jgi:hypothetical protein
MAILLLTAAGLKAQQLMTKPVFGTGPLESRWFLIGVVEFELLFAFWLLSRFLPSRSEGEGDDGLTWLASLTLFSAFVCISLWKALGGEATCGCFGRFEVNPWYTTVMDSIFIAALIRFRPQSPQPRRFPATFSPLRLGSVVVIWALVGGPVGFAMACFQPATLSDVGSVIGDGNVVVLEPERWVGKQLPLLNYIDIGEQLTRGKWTVVFYRSGCPDCEAVLRDYKQRASATVLTERVALVEVPPYGDSREGSGLPGPTFISGRLSDAREWFVKTPLQVKLTDGIVSWQSEQDHNSLAIEQRTGGDRG